VTCLRKMMLEGLQRRNYTESTIRHYIRAVEDFSRRFLCDAGRSIRSLPPMAGGSIEGTHECVAGPNGQAVG
jgi:hypothetical protein